MSRTRNVGGVVLFAIVLGALASGTARADGGFRCGGDRVIRFGESEGEVSGKCGQPDAVRTWTETRRETIWQDGKAVQREVAIPCAEWTYDLGRDRLIRYVTFEKGRLAQVRTGSYGSKPIAERPPSVRDPGLR